MELVISAGEPPRVGCCCTLLHWPAAALAQPVELSEHLLRTRLHSSGGAHGSTCAQHSCWRWSDAQPALSVYIRLPYRLQSSRSLDPSDESTEPSLH